MIAWLERLIFGPSQASLKLDEAIRAQRALEVKAKLTVRALKRDRADVALADTVRGMRGSSMREGSEHD